MQTDDNEMSSLCCSWVPETSTSLSELRISYNTNRVKLIAVLSDESGGTVTKIAETEDEKPVTARDVAETSVKSEIVRLNASPSSVQQIRAALKVDAIVTPQTLVVKRNKTIVKRLNGFDKDTKSTLVRAIEDILKK